ncbi:MAG: hypothetical protein JNL25_15375 [Rhodospirillaceae bacterium]|nr:hypothetical protein [Rhodospirillaceae bacterium]
MMIVSQSVVDPADFVARDAEQYCAALRALDSVANETVHMKLLAWVMGLPAGIDPADAAQMVLHQQVAASGTRISAPLMKLIETVAQYPRDRLARMVSGRRQAVVN